MNGSRSNTPNHASRSSLDQLNRTIEGLEARIQGLVSERKAPPVRNAAVAGRNPVDEIIERQRALGGPRERVNAALERSPRADTEPRRAQPAWVEPERAAPAPNMAAFDDIAATLAALRDEIRQGLNPHLAHDIAEIRSDMRGLKSVAAQAGGADVVRDELARLGDSIDRLGNLSRLPGTSELMAEIGDLRMMASGLAREDSVRVLEQQWDRTESRLAALDPDLLKDELVQLAWRIDDLKTGLGELSAAPAVRALEDKLIALASSIEVLGRTVGGREDLSGQLEGLDRRLDEISRAIAATAAQSSAATDSAAFQRLENRIAELTSHVDLIQAPAYESEIAERIETLTGRIEELASEDAARKLEDRIVQLSKLIERNFREGQDPAVANNLADLSRKIDGLGGNQSDALMERLEHLAHRLDAFEMPAADPSPLAMADLTAMSRLETRLSDIAARLDETTAAPATDNEALHSLEQQIASLSRLISQPGPSAVAVPDEYLGRMAALEDYIASSDEFIVEAARQAAEAVVEAYSRSGSMASSAPVDMSAIVGLAEDLRALEAHTRGSEERTAETFSALHQTLVQIAGRLDDLGEHGLAPMAAEPKAQPVVARSDYERPAVAMPKASQPEFAASVMPSVIDLAKEAEPVRPSAPRNPKVDVLQDDDMLAAAASSDIAADVSDALEVASGKDSPASKSLIASLAARFRPSRKQKPAAERVTVDPAPALDAGEMVVTEESNLLLEPGSGVPDVKKIMEKVRAGQKAQSSGAVGGADVIAAARRAAKAAAQEAGAQKAVKGKDAPKFKAPASQAEKSRSLFGAAGETRRPILLAAAAVLLVVMSYPLVSNMIGGRRAAAPADQPAAVVAPVEKSATLDAAPALEEPAKTPVADTPEENRASENKTIEDLPAAKPAAAETSQLDPADMDTGTKTLMAPAVNTDQASMLEKPAVVPAAEDDQELAAAEQPVASDMPVDTRPADTAAVASTEMVPPEGLQPASLVEAAKKADPMAYFEIGSRLTDGKGLKIDLVAAAKWYQLAADKGMAPAEYRLASFYEKGTGVARDLVKAEALYRKAAQKGNASSMHNLAVLHATGAAGTPDFVEASQWFKAAAELNVRDSQFNLAILYARGNGLQQDLVESYKWFAVAAAQGDQDAAQKRDEVANALSADQLKDAKARAELWKPKPLDEATNSPMIPDAWQAKSNTTASIDMKRAIRNIQAILNNNGFDAGKPDGEMGRKTVQAIKSFQKSVGQEATGRIDDALVKELLKRNKKA